MLRALRKFCVIGVPALTMACTGQIGTGGRSMDRGASPTDPGNPDEDPGIPDPGKPNDPGVKPPVKPGDMSMPSIDPPQTISPGGKCVANKPGPRMLRRLTAEQLDNSVRDLFRNASAPKSDVFNDPQVLGFTGDANALLVRDLGSQQLMSYAEQVARWSIVMLM